QRDPAMEPRTDDGFLGDDETLQAMTTEDLVGSSVRSRIEDEEIGTIEDILIDAQGNPAGVVVSVGEFLDTDEKLVALEWDRISLEDPAQPGARGAVADGQQMEDGEFTIIVDATREELENAPEFDREAWEREQDQARAGNDMDNGY
ncbi:MAG: PRC-barrel domain-containing protein, partial [Wenzhouxiangella sp.]